MGHGKKIASFLGVDAPKDLELEVVLVDCGANP
jgi:hypothetical protein